MTSLAEQIFGDMESSGVSPGNFTLAILVKMYGKAYTTIITGSLKHGDVAGAVRLLAAALAAGAQLAEDLVDNVCFMARRRNLAHLLTPLAPRLAAGGYAARDRSGSPTGEAVSPSETAGSRFHARRKQSQSWRDVVVQG